MTHPRKRRRRQTWRDKANAAIASGVEKGRAQGLEGRQLMRFVSRQCYPFYEREHWPYKVWLSAIRQWFGLRKRSGKVLRHPDQLQFFFEENKKGDAS